MAEHDSAPGLDYRDPEWVARRLGIDKNTVYKHLQDGTLPGLQLGRKWLISERRLSGFLADSDRRQTQARRRLAPLWPSDLRGFDLFTSRARAVMGAAREAAIGLNDDHIGTEHLLVALAGRPDCVGAHALVDLGVDLAALSAEIRAAVPDAGTSGSSDVSFTPRLRNVIVRAVKVARNMRHHYVGTEHLLLAILTMGEGPAYQLLASRSITLPAARSAVERRLARHSPRP
ncbi:MAG: excisionase family DNA-binding protein [Chloroflexota bacterium]|nr:excisionase family DNA-binding protein [Chloroflexota bacterium]